MMRSAMRAMVLACGVMAGTLVQAEDAPALRIVALGDLPYGAPDQVYPPYETLIAEINARAPDLVLHVGDTKGGGACTDQVLDEQLAYMQSFTAPLIYTPGDNEWTDCHRVAGEYDDPLERLAYIRKTYFADPSTSFGEAPIALQHQGALGYPENTAYRVGSVGIIAAHIVGSNNNFEARSIEAVEEFFARSAASTNWLLQGFETFAEAEIIVVAIHADMFEFDFNSFNRENWLRHSGFNAFGSALKRAARGFGKPVLLVFGDSHVHKVFQPFPKYAPNVTAVEVYGYPDMHAVDISLYPGARAPFDVRTIWNPDTID